MKCGWVFFLTRNTASCHYDQSEVTIVYIVAGGSLGKFCLTGIVNTCMPAHQGAHSIPTTCVNPYSKLHNYQTYYGNMNT